MRLLLLRHAKSDWSGKAADHERPLAPRGRKAAQRIGAYMRKKTYEPAFVLCSTAERSKETLEFVLAALAAAPKIRYDRALYLTDWQQLLAEIRDCSTDASPLLLVGHNPGLEQLAIALALQPQDPAERARAQKLAQKFPAGALAVLDFELEHWSQIKPGLGRLVDFVRPKEIGEQSGAEQE